MGERAQGGMESKRRGSGPTSSGAGHGGTLGAERTLQSLVVLAHCTEGLTISQMAAELSTNRQVVYRLVEALQASGFAFRSDDGKVRLGLGILDVARQVYPTLRSVATPLLRKLADETSATAHLTVVSNDQAYALAVEEPVMGDLHISYRVGATHSLERGAAGRAILEWRRERAREGGRDEGPMWVASEGELQAGARGIASALRGVPGLDASIGVVCLGDLDEDRAGPLVVEACADLASLLRA